MSNKEKKKGFLGEFKEFINRGNIVDMAVGIIVGSAFTAIVNSLVNDMLTPLLGLFSKDGFVGLYLGLWENGVAATDITLKNGAVIAAGEVTYRTYIYYGSFIQSIVNFLLIAFSVFCIVKILNRIQRMSEETRLKIEKEIEEKMKKKEALEEAKE